MRNLIILPLMVLFLSVSLMAAHSNVLVQDTEDNANDNFFLTSGSISTGSGNSGDYVVLACANNNAASNFNDPSPLSWTPLDVNPCAGPNCNLGIWGGFVNDPNNQVIGCSWDQDAVLFVAGSIRYSDVHPFSPIIDVACNTGISNIITSPSINTEPGSQVLRVFVFGSQNFGPSVVSSDINNILEIENQGSLEGDFSALALSDGPILGIVGTSVFSPQGGPTGPINTIADVEIDWRACTIGIRMKPSVVPTMSEWGLISFAAFAGVAGIWYLRRRAVTA